MTLMFNSQQIQNELTRIQQVKELTWEDIIKDRLNDNLTQYIRDINELVQTLYNKGLISVLRKFM